MRPLRFRGSTAVLRCRFLAVTKKFSALAPYNRQAAFRSTLWYWPVIFAGKNRYILSDRSGWRAYPLPGFVGTVCRMFRPGFQIGLLRCHLFRFPFCLYVSIQNNARIINKILIIVILPASLILYFLNRFHVPFYDSLYKV